MSDIYDWARGESSSVDDIYMTKFKKLETLIHSMWLLLKKNGYTNEMLDEAIAEALDIEAEGPAYLKGMVCPNCGRNAQLSGSFKIKCIYCGMESVINPYEARDIANQFDEALAEQQAEQEQKERWASAVQNDPYQPYDVSKDLNFDDYDDGNGVI